MRAQKAMSSAIDCQRREAGESVDSWAPIAELLSTKEGENLARAQRASCKRGDSVTVQTVRQREPTYSLVYISGLSPKNRVLKNESDCRKREASEGIEDCDIAQWQASRKSVTNVGVSNIRFRHSFLQVRAVDTTLSHSFRAALFALWLQIILTVHTCALAR